MCKPSQLIKLYCAVCHHYDNTLVAHAQRQSNNFCPKFTDEECITILIWGISNQKFDVKRCHEFIVDYYGDWFPKLPGYEAFNKRVHFLADAFKVLAGILLGELGLSDSHADFIYDSMPIVLALEHYQKFDTSLLSNEYVIDTACSLDECFDNVMKIINSRIE